MYLKSIFRAFLIMCVFFGTTGIGTLSAEVPDNPANQGYFLVAQAKVKICPSCGYSNTAADVFCSECGTRLPRKAKAVSSRKKAGGSGGSDGSGVGKTMNLSFRYESTLGKYYNDSWAHTYSTSGVLSSTYTVSQIEETIPGMGIMIYTSKMFPLGDSESSFIEIEVGCGLSQGGFAKEWSLPASSPVFTGNVEWYTSNPDPFLDDSYTYIEKDEVIMTAAPVLGRLLYNQFIGKSLRVRAGLGLGVYFVNTRIKTTETETYTQDSGTYKRGETDIRVTYTDAMFILSASELTVGLDYKLFTNISIGFGVNLGMPAQSSLWLFENTVEHFPSGCNFSSPPKVVIKNGIEVGGSSFGINGGVTFRF